MCRLAAVLAPLAALAAAAMPPALGAPIPRSPAAGYHLTQRDGVMLYNRRLRADRYRLVARRGAGRAHDVGVPDQAQPFLPDLGADARGRTIAVYPRGLRLVVLDLATGAERTAATTPTVARAIAIDRGRIAYATIGAHASTIWSVPADSSAAPRRAIVVGGTVVALDRGPHGLAYVVEDDHMGDDAHTRRSITFRARTIAVAGWGEEGGADIVSVGFAGIDLVWGISGRRPDVSNYGTVERLNLRTGHRWTLSVPGGGLIAAAPDSARATAPTLLAFEPGTPEPGYGPDPDHAVLRRFPATAFARRHAAP